MKLVREARTLKSKSLASLRRGLSAFNSYEEDGRTTSVLLHLQHASEMLLKALLVQNRTEVFDKKSGTSIGFARCANLAQAAGHISASQAGVMRAIDSLRDAEQHWLLKLDEGLMYMHARALVTVFDEVLKSLFDDALISNLPVRVLPVSSHAPQNIEVLMDREYAQIRELLTPGRRARDEARGRIRALLAMESHLVEDVAVSEKDIDRVENAIRANTAFAEVFPRLTSLGTVTGGAGIEVTVHFTKRQGAPVVFVPADNIGEAAAVRQVDLRNKYHITPTELAKKVGLSIPKAALLRRHLKIDDDVGLRYVFEHGKARFPSYADAAVEKMRQGMNEIDIDALWRTRGQGQ
jgi:uncharacterized protein YjiS (DUF1127 family)